MSENIIKTKIQGLLVIERPKFADERGFFREVFRLSELEEAIGMEFRGRQWNHSVSKPGVIRALHAESWNKLVYPMTGRMFAAIVDIRPGSKTFGKVETFEFDAAEPKALFIPIGLGNSICVLGDEDVHYMYLVDAEYTGQDMRAIAWDDPDLAIKWPVEEPIISERDKNNPTLKEMFPEKTKTSNMKILITGSDGMLAKALFRVLFIANELDEAYEVELANRVGLDITDADAVMKYFKEGEFDVVINAAAYTAVDKAEEEGRLAHRVNGDGPRNLAIAAKAIGAKLIHFSTDYVFAGDKQDGYDESFDGYDPVNAYGKSKLMGEKALKEVGGDWYLIRTSWLYGPGGGNFVDTMIRLMGERDSLNVVNDQHGKPTYTMDLAHAVRELIEGDFRPGVYHMSNDTDEDGITWFDFACGIADLIGFDSNNIQGVPSTEYPTPAKRPNYSMLINTKLPPRRDWRTALEEYVESKTKD